MSLSDSVRMALKKARKNQTDLIRVAKFTGGKLAFIYPDGQQILIEAPETEEAGAAGTEQPEA